VQCLPTAEGLAAEADLIVLPADSLQDERLVDLAHEAIARGRRLAVVTNALAAELPRPLRGQVSLLDAPLRARHVAQCVDSSPPPTEPVPEEPQGRLARLSVLAAEDNEVNALVLEAIMRMEGAQLTLVENGRLAVERLAEAGPGRFQLVLTDIQMPEMDGYAATRAMLQLDPSLPIVGLTAHAMPEERERCLAAGMVDHLAKPVDIEQLVTVALRHARKTAR
jgi:CheY-like chemotaxis protein